jgi:hypothetical protein
MHDGNNPVDAGSYPSSSTWLDCIAPTAPMVKKLGEAVGFDDALGPRCWHFGEEPALSKQTEIHDERLQYDLRNAISIDAACACRLHGDGPSRRGRGMSTVIDELTGPKKNPRHKQQDSFRPPKVVSRPACRGTKQLHHGGKVRRAVRVAVNVMFSLELVTVAC